MVILVRVHCGITSAHSGNTSACTVVLLVCVHTMVILLRVQLLVHTVVILVRYSGITSMCATMVILVRVHCGITSAHSGNTSAWTVVLLVCVLHMVLLVCVHNGNTSACTVALLVHTVVILVRVQW